MFKRSVAAEISHYAITSHNPFVHPTTNLRNTLVVKQMELTWLN